MRRFSLLVAILALFASALPVAAKGPVEATITGPGIDEPIVLDGRADVTLQDGKLIALTNAVAFWELAYFEDNSPQRPQAISAEAPTAELGPEFIATVIHAGPGGLAEVVVYLYPDAVGGPLAYVEPDVAIAEMRAVTTGGWYAAPTSLSDLLEGYGVDMAQARKDTALAVGSAGSSPTPGWLVPIGLIVVFAGWAVGRRPRRPVAS
jgi:hypothetical protein